MVRPCDYASNFANAETALLGGDICISAPVLQPSGLLTMTLNGWAD